MVGLAGTARAASVTLAWDAPTDPSVTGFTVYYGTQSGVYTNKITAGMQTTLVVSNLPDGGSYYFVVKSYNASGTESTPSNEVASGVIGTTPLSIVCPAPTSTSSTGNPVSVSFTPTVSGGVSPYTTSCAPASGSLFPVGTTSFTCNATDSLGATASCSSTVTVTSSAPQTLPPPPQISCPVISSVTATNNKWATVTYSSPTVSGGLAPVATACSPASGSRFAVGTTTVTCTATDAAQRQSSCSTTATVLPRR
jgi:hypothetical protein